MNTDYIEHIEDYLNDRLSKVDRKAYEEEMSKDPDLKDAVDHFPLVLESLEASIQEEARIALQHINKKEKHSAIIIFFEKYKNVAARAASFTLIVTFGMFGYGNMKYSPKALTTSYYQVPTDLTEQGSISVKELIIDEDNITSTEDRYLLAHKFFETGNFENALNYFEQVVTSKDIRFYEDAQFYMALCLIRQDKTQEAIELLTEIKENADHPKSRKANDLYNKLTGFWSHFVLR